ncbi:MAG: ribonuclease D [Idiomarina sp.]|nr:ribonuclease D [Idiomarina sp.]
MQYRMINATSELVAFCDRARESGWLALDTEFVRTRTYLADLGLVQLHAAEQLVLVDPLNGVDLSPLWELLADPKLVTVMHAGGEDLEIIGTYQPGAPAQMFDTQVAWSFLHQGTQIGYAALVAEFFDVTLDKSQSRTDWLKRPLTEAQLDYAAADAHYLAAIYPTLREQIEASEQYPFFVAECKFQVEKRTRRLPVEFAWRDVGGFAHMKGQQRAVMAELARWRLEICRRENIALPFMLRDPVMTALAQQQPSQLSQLAQVPDIHPRVVRKYGSAILAAIERGLNIPEADWPKAIPRLDDHPAYKRWFKEAKALIAERAEAAGVAATLLGSRKQINEVFIWCLHTDDAVKAQVPGPELLSSWRLEVAGTELLKLTNAL